LKKIDLSNIKIVSTGTGRVGRGVKELLSILGVKQVSVDAFLNDTFNEPVFVQLESLDYYTRADANQSSKKDFYENPKRYTSDFMKFASVSDVLIAGHFHAPNAPSLFTRDDAKLNQFKIRVVSDISCDINGPIASTIRSSSIINPIYGYNPQLESEDVFNKESVISVVAIDNLPCELPKEASEGFGDELIENVLPSLFNADNDGVLKRATICDSGSLSSLYNYLNKYANI